MPMHEFTTGEVQAMRTVIATFVANRDDLIAAFMLTGGFHYLGGSGGSGLVDLVAKLEAVPLTHPAHDGLNASCPRAPDLGARTRRLKCDDCGHSWTEVL